MTTSADCHPRAKEIKEVVVSELLRNLKTNRFSETPTPFIFEGDYHEYADSLNLNLDNARDVAKQLGLGIAVLYNAVVQNAVICLQHKTVTDLFANNNLRINFIINIDDLYTGWVGFKFYFSSSV